MAFAESSLVSEARKFIGDPYVFGAAGPRTFDCSGLVQFSLEKLGLKNVPRTSEAQWAWVDKIKMSQLQPGDLIFEQWPGDQSPPGHVVIYAGTVNGVRKVIEAPQPGQNVHERTWSPSETKIIGYGRVPGGTQGSSDNSGGSAPALGLAGGISEGLSTIPGFGQLGSGIANLSGVGQTVGDIATAIAGVSHDMDTALHFMAALFRPNLWLRVGAFFAGIVALIIGLVMLGKAVGVSAPSPGGGGGMPMVVPV
jgi:hypothetical protein